MGRNQVGWLPRRLGLRRGRERWLERDRSRGDGISEGWQERDRLRLAFGREGSRLCDEKKRGEAELSFELVRSPRRFVSFPRANKRTKRHSLLSQPTGLTLPPAPIADPDLFDDPKVRQRHQMARASLVEHLPTVPAVVFPVGEGEGSSTSKAHFRVDPCGSGGGGE